MRDDITQGWGEIMTVHPGLNTQVLTAQTSTVSLSPYVAPSPGRAEGAAPEAKHPKHDVVPQYAGRIGGRRPLKTTVRVHDAQGWGPFSLESVDIGVTGVFLQSSLFMEPGEIFTLEFRIPGESCPMHVRAVVSRVAEHPVLASGRKTGMAFRFLNLTPGARRVILRYLNPPMHH